MTASVAQSKTAGSSAPGATLSATFDSSPTNGNVMLCAVSSDTTMTAGPSGWTERVAQVGNQGFYVYTKTVSGDSATVTVDPNGDNPTAMVIVELAGVSTYEAVSSVADTQASWGLDRTTNAVTPAGAAGYLACYSYANNTAAAIDLLSAATIGSSFTVVAVARSTTGQAATLQGVYVGFLAGSGAQSPTLTGGANENAYNRTASVLAFTEAATVVLPPLHAALPNIAAIVSAHY